MNRLESLRTSLTDMSHTERLEYIGKIREDRKISKHAITTRKKRSEDKTKRIEKAFDTLTDEEKREMIKALGG